MDGKKTEIAGTLLELAGNPLILVLIIAHLGHNQENTVKPVGWKVIKILMIHAVMLVKTIMMRLKTILMMIVTTVG